jgi:hypothetical protein
MSTDLKTELLAKLPGKPLESGEVLYTLFYRQGNNPHPLQLNFILKTTEMRVVMERTKKHCDLMNYRFVRVQPFMTDLDRAEKVQSGDYNNG